MAQQIGQVRVRLRIGPEQYQYLADALNLLGVTLFRKSGRQFAALVAGLAVYFHFDQFVIMQGSLSLFDDGGGDATVADADNGAQVVCDPAQSAEQSIVQGPGL